MPKFLDATDKAAAKAAINADYAINVKDYAGIDLTGATASDTAFQSILTAAAAAAAAGTGNVEVYIPPGILSLTTRVTVGAGVTIRGAGRNATTVTGSNTSGVLELTGASDITITDLTVESTATGTTAIGIASTYNGLQQRVSVTNCRITGTTNATGGVKFLYAVEQLTFSDNIIEDCASGFSLLAPDHTNGLISTQIVINHNRFRNVGAVNLQLYGAGPASVNGGNYSTISNVEISGNDLRDFAQTGTDGPIPIEPTGITNVRIANNVIDGTATRGISTANNVNMTITGNTIRNQSIYAIELNGGRQISIIGNTAENCATFAMETGYMYRVVSAGGGVQLSDVVIANNVYVGSGPSTALAGESTARAVIRLVTASRVRITGNSFTDWQFIPFAIRIGVTQAEVDTSSPGDTSAAEPVPVDCVVEGNTFVISDADTVVRTISVEAGTRTNVVRNTLRINRNLVAGDSNAVIIGAKMDPLVSDTLIEGNHIQFSGTVAAATEVTGIGNPAATAAACAKLTVLRNRITNGARGLYIRTNSDDTVVVDNETVTCASADVIPATAHGSVGAGSLQLFNAAPGANYEKFMARYVSNVAEIATMFGGTGSARSLRLGVVSSASASPGGSSLLSRYLQFNSTFPYAQFSATTGGIGSMVQVGGTFTAASSNQAMLAISPTMNQTSTAGYTMLLINPTDSGNTGTGTRLLIDAQVTGTSKFKVDNTGLATANNHVSAKTSVTTAAGTPTTMTIASTQTQVFTGSTTQTVKLPTTSVVAGQQYTIINQSSGDVTVQSSGANTIATMTGGANPTAKLFIALQDTPTADTHWRAI